MATSQFQEVAETTTGTTQGSSRSTLNSPFAGIRVLQQQREPEADGPAAEYPDEREDDGEHRGVQEGRRLHDVDVVGEADEVARRSAGRHCAATDTPA